MSAVQPDPEEEPAESGIPPLTEYLGCARPLDVVPLGGGGGHARKRTVILEGGVAVAAKYDDPTPGGQAGAQIRAEAAAWTLARELGWHHLVALTVLRNLEDPDDPSGVVEASVQVLHPRFKTSIEGGFAVSMCADDDRLRCAAFDVLASNTDRNNGNWGMVADVACPRLIDHGHAFETFAGPPGGDFVMASVGHSLPDDILAELKEFIAHESNSDLSVLLGAQKAGRVFARARTLVGTATVPAP